jgi:hypothetical protein
VLDASALLALIHGEPGPPRVRAALRQLAYLRQAAAQAGILLLEARLWTGPLHLARARPLQGLRLVLGGRLQPRPLRASQISLTPAAPAKLAPAAPAAHPCADLPLACRQAARHAIPRTQAPQHRVPRPAKPR